LGIILLPIIGIIWFIVSPKLRLKSKKYLPPSTTIFGATHVFQNQDKREAIEHLNEEHAGKKMKEEENGEPERK
jgi:hypothetical protein